MLLDQRTHYFAEFILDFSKSILLIAIRLIHQKTFYSTIILGEKVSFDHQ